MKKRIRGVRTIPIADGYAIVVTDRAHQRPTTVRFEEDGDVRVDNLKFDRREFAAVVAAVKAGPPRKAKR